MQEAEDSRIRDKDQVDGTNMSSDSKKGVKVSGKYSVTGDREGQDSLPGLRPTDNPIVTSIRPPHCRPSVYTDSQQEESVTREEQIKQSHSHEAGVSKQTMEELKSVLKDTTQLHTKERNEHQSWSPYTYLHGTKADGRQDEGSSKSFSTFRPLTESTRRSSRPRGSTASQQDGGSSRSLASSTQSSSLRSPTPERSHWEETWSSETDNNKDTTQTDMIWSRSFISDVEQIKQYISREDVSFVRFEATDLHGVSRSKTVPARFFHEKAVYGVPMPRSYLELTLSPKINEVDHPSAPNFSSDVLLIPDLSTFRILPWTEQTARIICDPCMVTGTPLRTSPRLIAKQLLGQLRNMGFSLHSCFTYECYILGAPERVGPKTVFFPATTLLSNHDLPFLQHLVNGMYYMGVDVDSFASASGPGQMEISFKPQFGIEAADSAFTFRTGIKEVARKFSYIVSFFTDDGIYNSGLFSHSLWDANGRRSLFHTGNGEMSEIGRKWLAGLLHHAPALSCLLAPGIGCRSQLTKDMKDRKRPFYATCGYNNNSCAFNVKLHGGRLTHIDNRLGSAMANPYIVLAATVAAGLDGIKRNLSVDQGLNRAPAQQKEFAIPVKLEDALEALEEDSMLCGALGEPFVQYFLAMKRFEIETQELDAERNKSLEYFI
ncbi:lengsin isoform X2 [Chanos chanos]|uniref:Lengsin n=1 Tax=Chanos chanos TaxID=29144 RepID=A0A6J2VCF6_CHACN|nr:lengsin isoform X2 [Chanos chanos]